jgi:hypothetical protein
MRFRSDAGQVSLVAIVAALLVVGLLGAASIGLMLGGGGSGGSGSNLAAGIGVGTADDVSAKTALSQAQTAVAPVAAAGGYGGITAQSLTESDPDTTFSSGPSVGVSIVSVASTGGSSADDSGTGGVSIPGAAGITVPSGVVPGQDNPTPGGSTGGGSVTMTAFSPSGTCWYLWLGSGGPFYGAQTGQKGCQATALPTAPAPSSVSSTEIGWAPGSFPAP